MAAKRKQVVRNGVGMPVARSKPDTPKAPAVGGPPTDRELARARTGRTVALVIAGSILLWLAAHMVGRLLELPIKYAYLFDLMALGALFWALVVSVQLWRKRNER